MGNTLLKNGMRAISGILRRYGMSEKDKNPENENTDYALGNFLENYAGGNLETIKEYFKESIYESDEIVKPVKYSLHKNEYIEDIKYSIDDIITNYQDIPGQPAEHTVRPLAVLPGTETDRKAVIAMFGQGAQLLHVEDAGEDCRNSAQRMVIRRPGETVESFVKRYCFSMPGAELSFRRESVLLPKLMELGLNTPEVFGLYEAEKEGRIAMRCYEAVTFGSMLAKLPRAQKMAYLKRIVSSLVRMQHVVKENARDILTEIGASPGIETILRRELAKASLRISGSEDVSPQADYAIRRSADSELYPAHLDFTPRNILVTDRDDIIITDVELMTIPGAMQTGAPITLDYSTLMMWPGMNLDAKDQLEMDRYFVGRWNRLGNPINMNEFCQLKQATDLISAQRFAGIYALLCSRSSSQQNYEMFTYFKQKAIDSAEKSAA
jgi:hypothetical protein